MSHGLGVVMVAMCMAVAGKANWLLVQWNTGTVLCRSRHIIDSCVPISISPQNDRIQNAFNWVYNTQLADLLHAEVWLSTPVRGPSWLWSRANGNRRPQYDLENKSRKRPSIIGSTYINYVHYHQKCKDSIVFSNINSRQSRNWSILSCAFFC